MTRNKPQSLLHAYIDSKGSMTIKNPEIVRLSRVTGFSTEHIYRVAIGDRVPAQKCAIALVSALKGKLDISVDNLVGNALKPADALDQG